MKTSIYLLWITGSVIISLVPYSVQAQISPDGSTPTSPANCSAVCNITGGTKAGENLFHSFTQFNIAPEQEVTFIDPGVTNIITRVTGSNPSNIFGTLNVAGDANLFLINPQGIIFGSTATINISGSFVATTANALQFDSQGSFSVDPANNPNLLTVNPSAFLFNQINTLVPPSIEVQNSFISPSLGQSLLLVGSNINITDGVAFLPSGRIELGSVIGEGSVGLNYTNNNQLSLNFPQNISKGDITIRDGLMFVAGDGSGSVAMNARNILLEDTYIQASTEQGTQTGVPGSITLDASGAIALVGSILSNSVAEEAVGNAGDINLSAASVLIDRDSSLNSVVNSSASGNAGKVSINANNGVVLSNDSEISTSVAQQGNGGDVQIFAGSLSLENKGRIYTDTTAQGDAGDVYINVVDSVALTGQETFIRTATSGTNTNSGNVDIQARSLALSDNAVIYTDTTGEAGRAGNLLITVSDTVSLANGTIYNDTSGLGNAGNTRISARGLKITDGGSISTSTNGVGDAGNIFINATEFVTLSGVNPDKQELLRGIVNTTSSGLFASTEENASGRGGSIQVNTPNLSILDGAVINARTRSAAPGGNITVNAQNVAATGGGQILTTAFNRGMAGSITVDAGNRVVISGSDRTYNARLQQAPERVDNDGAASGFLARVRGTEIADAGEIKVSAPSIILTDQGTISTATTQGEGGQISLQGRNVFLQNNGSISATAGTQNAGGNGGNINIDSDLFFAVRNSRITAEAFTGNGGNIRIATQGIFVSPSTTITARSQLGTDGIVEIITLDDEPSDGLVSLPAQPVDVGNLVTQGCGANNNNVALNNSEFIIAGRGGLPPTPSESLNTNAALVDLGIPTQPQANFSQKQTAYQPTTIDSQPTPLVEAQGWIIDANGEVVLTAQAPNIAHRASTPVACNAQ